MLALDNLIDNAMRYSGSSRELGSVRASARLSNLLYVTKAKASRRRARAREGPFCTRAIGSGHGSGLGLAIVNQIVTDHGGTLRIESSRAAARS